MKQKKPLLLIALLISSISGWAQKPLVDPDADALEGIFVEKYYKATQKDCEDTVGGILPKGSVTYRIYVDLKTGYKLQAVYGTNKHEFFLRTTTSFFNSSLGGQSGEDIYDTRINQHNLALDSWLTIGSCSKGRVGIMKEEDKDSSIIKRPTLDKADGMVKIDANNNNKLLYYGIDLSPFSKGNTLSNFQSNNGSWVSVHGGVGPTKTNRILIAQLTTDGKLSFELNLQLVTPGGGSVQFVAKDPTGNEIKSKYLTYKSK